MSLMLSYVLCCKCHIQYVLRFLWSVCRNPGRITVKSFARDPTKSNNILSIDCKGNNGHFLSGDEKAFLFSAL